MELRELTWARDIVTTIEKIRLFDSAAISDLHYDIQDLVTQIGNQEVEDLETLRGYLVCMADKRVAYHERKEAYELLRRSINEYRQLKGKGIDRDVQAVIVAIVGLAKGMREGLANETPLPLCSSLSDGLSWEKQRRQFLDRLDGDLGPFLLLGPTGSGKSSFAREIWERFSELCNKELPWAEVDCGQANDPESVIFGTVKDLSFNGSPNKKGALEEANGGVLFLDEVSRMSTENQNKLLRALNLDRDGCYHFTRMGDTEVRRSRFVLITATSQPIDKWVGEGGSKFLPDLFYRIGGEAPLRLPRIEEQGDYFDEVFESRLEFYSQYNPIGLPRGKMRIVGSDQAGRRLYREYIHRKEWQGGVRSLDRFAIELVRLARSNSYTINQTVVESAIRSFESPRGVSDGSATEFPVLPEDQVATVGRNSVDSTSDFVDMKAHEVILQRLKITPLSDDKVKATTKKCIAELAKMVVLDAKRKQADIAVAVRESVDRKTPASAAIQWVNDQLERFCDSEGSPLGWKTFKNLVLAEKQDLMNLVIKGDAWIG